MKDLKKIFLIYSECWNIAQPAAYTKVLVMFVTWLPTWQHRRHGISNLRNLRCLDYWIIEDHRRGIALRYTCPQILAPDTTLLPIGMYARILSCALGTCLKTSLDSTLKSELLDVTKSIEAMCLRKCSIQIFA